jgi:hypothetical protein
LSQIDRDLRFEAFTCGTVSFLAEILRLQRARQSVKQDASYVGSIEPGPGKAEAIEADHPIVVLQKRDYHIHHNKHFFPVSFVQPPRTKMKVSYGKPVFSDLKMAA